MTELDDIIPAKVVSIINKYGLTAAWITQTKTYDPTTDQTTIGTPSETSVKVTPPAGCVIDYVPTPNQSAGGGAIKGVGLRVLTTPSHLGTVKPRIYDDHVRIGAVTYQVVRVDPIYSGELIAAYKVYLIGNDVV